MNKLYRTAWIAGLSLMTATPALAAAEGAEGDPMKLYYLEMIWAVVLFILFAAVLGFVVSKILGALQAREQKLEGDLVGAEKARAEADEALATYKAKIAEAQKEAQSVVEEARKSAEQAGARIKADTEAEIAKMKDRAAAEIEAAKDAALNEVYAQAAELSTQIAGRILKREISAADQQQLVSESLAELTKTGV
ncbi:MAG: F0F1 ATP synthase subunit B [Phycisphaeraceae bacterium]